MRDGRQFFPVEEGWHDASEELPQVDGIYKAGRVTKDRYVYIVQNVEYSTSRKAFVLFDFADSFWSQFPADFWAEQPAITEGI